MRIAPFSNDHRLLADLQAPPDLRDGVESLDYWRARRRQLPWYELRARREATEMIVRWEQRVRAALIQERGTPVGIRVSAGLLVAQTTLRRWTGRAAIALIVTVAIVTALTVAAAILVLQAL